jgi:hypothetical protein
MKKNLKKYNDFINEELTAHPKLKDSYLQSNLDINNAEIFLILRSNFYDAVISMTGDLSPRSFSDMCKKELNPEEDYNEMKSLMDKKGWDMQSIKNLFSSKVDKLCGYSIAKFVRGERTEDFQEVIGELRNKGVSVDKIDDMNDPFKSDLDSQNGHTDVYLYFLFKELGLNKNFISLGGEGWGNYNEGDELWIRYKYGYHQTKYGQMMLDQIGYTTEKFKEEALAYLQQYIEDYWEESLIRSLEKTLSKQSGGRTYPLSTPLRNLLTGMNIKEYTLVEEDRMIIFTNEISSLINKEGLAKVEAKEIADALIKQYDWLDDSGAEGEGDILQEVDGDVIIWGKFKVDF